MEAEELIFKYFDLDANTVGAEVRHSVSGELREIYQEFITPCENDALLLEAFQRLSEHFRGGGKIVSEDSFGDATAKYRRDDLLRLYVFGNETGDDYNNLIIKCKHGSVRLANCCNWIWNDVLKPYLNKNLTDIGSVEQAKNELLTGRSKRGRKPNDARIPVIMWGTYRLLTDFHGFDTPMPNCLCNYVIGLLQFMEILPEDTEIDSLWVRAELRYIKSRKGA